MITKLYKFNFTKLIAILLVGIVFTTSCENQWIDPELNVNPDAPADVPMEFLLPAIQANMGYDLGGNTLMRTSNIWMQYFNGFNRQSLTEARYQVAPSDPNNVWNSSYSGTLMDCTKLLEKATEASAPHYSAVAKIHIAITLGNLTDFFNDIPYSDAFKGTEGVLSPTFDTQQEIYATIQTLLSEAISEFAQGNGGIALSGDMIYGGDATKWTQAAYSLKARYALNLSLKNSTAAADALGFAASGLTSYSDDTQVPFADDKKSPLFQFMADRGDITMGANFLDMLNATSDPRTSFYATDEGDGFAGGVAGSDIEAGISLPGEYSASEASPVILMSFMETQFIIAEANFMNGDLGAAAVAYNTGVTASVLKVTGDDGSGDTWLSTNAAETTSTITLEKIMNAKYLAMYSQNQPYSDWRRTGFPVLTLAIGAVKSEIPTRFPYAQDEITYNSNTPVVTILDRVWWDN